MIRVVVLALAVIVTALGVVLSKHEARKQFVEQQKLERERDRMNVEWGQLLLEEGAWSSHARIEKLARGRLGMHMPTADEIVIVRREP